LSKTPSIRHLLLASRYRSATLAAPLHQNRGELQNVRHAVGDLSKFYM